MHFKLNWMVILCIYVRVQLYDKTVSGHIIFRAFATEQKLWKDEDGDEYEEKVTVRAVHMHHVPIMILRICGT